MSLDALTPAFPSSHRSGGPTDDPVQRPTHEAPDPWWSPFSFVHLARRPQWVFLAMLVSLLSTAMPMVHATVFGADRVAAATIAQIEVRVGEQLPDEGRAAVRESVIDRSPVLTACLSFVVTILAILLAGGCLNMGALMAGSDLTGAQALSVAALSSLAVIVLRVLLWLLVVVAVPLHQAAASDWLHVASVQLGMWLPSVSNEVAMTLLGAVDAYLLAGIALSVIGLRLMDRRIGFPGALSASCIWTGTVVGFRVLMSALLDIPIV